MQQQRKDHQIGAPAMQAAYPKTEAHILCNMTHTFVGHFGRRDKIKSQKNTRNNLQGE